MYKDEGETPEKPSNGKLMLSVPLKVHAAALVTAQVTGKSLNQWAAEILGKAAVFNA